MNIKGILLGDIRLDTNEFKVCSNWVEIVEVIRNNCRSAEYIRKTNETDIQINLSLDGKGKSSKFQQGIHFFDHMLEQLAKHSGIDLRIK